MLRKLLSLAVCIFALHASCVAQRISPADSVNPLVGTSAEGQTFPGVGIPFGMTPWTPATGRTEKGVTAYYYKDARIVGFRGSHFLSGSATQEYGSLQLLAGTGEQTSAEASSSYSHATETSHPYRYDVDLPDLNVHAAVTGTTRGGLMSFRFAKAGPAWISLGKSGAVWRWRSHDGSGSRRDRRAQCSAPHLPGDGKLAGFSGYAAVQFDHAFKPGGTWSGSALHAGSLTQAADAQPSNASAPAVHSLLERRSQVHSPAVHPPPEHG